MLRDQPKGPRRQELAQIHIAAKALALDDNTYRALLKRVTGNESAGALDAADRGRVIAEFQRLGWRPPRKSKLTGAARKIRALWLVLHKGGAVADASEQAMNAWVKRQTGRADVRWLDVDLAQRCIEQLKRWCDRLNIDYES